jgi:hypothetical protein
LSALPDDLQSAALAAHGDVYRLHERGFVTSRVERGRTDVASVVDAPFGIDFDFDASRFTPLDQWSYDTLDPV